MYVPYEYIPGGVYGICDRCGFKYRLSELRTEWTGLRVCPEDFDRRPYELDPPVLWPEGVPVPNARPEPPPIYNQTPLGPVVNITEENNDAIELEDGSGFLIEEDQ